MDLLQIPHDLHHLLGAKVNDFIRNGVWAIPSCLLQSYPILEDELAKITIPLFPSDDHRIWYGSDYGTLTFKEAYMFLNPPTQVVSWCSFIWKSGSPPFKSFLIWRILHNKMPTDEILKSKGCVTVSMCSMCCKDAESTSHLLFECPFVVCLWNWLSLHINHNVDHSSMISSLTLCNISVSS